MLNFGCQEYRIALQFDIASLFCIRENPIETRYTDKLQLVVLYHQIIYANLNIFVDVSKNSSLILYI